MTETIIQIEATANNQELNVATLRAELSGVGIEYCQQHGDIKDAEAYVRVFDNQRRRDSEHLHSWPQGTALRRPPTADERAAFELPNDAVYVAHLDFNGDLISCFETATPEVQ